jgi:uncharacterized protein YaaN involved in tellurite resistance
VDVSGREFRRLVEDVESLADRELRSASALGRGLAAISSRGVAVLDEQNGSIARCLNDLRRWARELAPIGELGPTSADRRFGIFGKPNPMRADEKRWARGRQALEETVATLRDAVARLRTDNARVAEEQLATATQIATLSDYSELAQQLDERLGSLIATLEFVDANRAGILKRELLFELRQRRKEILMQLAISTQGGAALRIIEENNLELIDAITAATTGTLGVLQTAAAARQALDVRRRLQAGLRAGRATEARHGGSQIPEYEALQQAWADVGDTLNQVERLRRQVNEAAAMLVRSDLR